jgi:hypothetical protein
MNNPMLEIQQDRSERIAKRADQAIGALNLGEVEEAKFQLEMIQLEANRNSGRE